MELEPSFDFSEIEDLDFELFNLPIYDLEDLKNTIKKFENNIFKDSKTGMYLIPGKEDVIKLSL